MPEHHQQTIAGARPDADLLAERERGMPHSETWPTQRQSGDNSGFDGVAQTMQAAFAAYSIKLALPRTPKYETRKQRIVKLQRTIAQKSHHTVKIKSAAHARKKRAQRQLERARPSSADDAAVVINDRGAVAWRTSENARPSRRNVPSPAPASRPAKPRHEGAGSPAAPVIIQRRTTKIAPLKGLSTRAPQQLPLPKCTHSSAARSREATSKPSRPSAPPERPPQKEPHQDAPQERRRREESQPSRAWPPKSIENPAAFSPSVRCEQRPQSVGSQGSKLEREAKRKEIQAQICRARARVQEERMRIAEAERITRAEAERVRLAARNSVNERLRAKDHARRLIYAKNKLMRAFVEAQNPVTAIPVAP